MGVLSGILALAHQAVTLGNHVLAALTIYG